MCQPGRPRPQGESHEVSSPSLWPFQSAKSRGSSFSSFCSSSSEGLRSDSSLVVPARQPAVVGEAGDAEVDVAAGRIREPAVDQRRDEADDLRDVLGRPGHRVRHLEPEIAGVLEVPACRLLRQRALAPGAAA